MERSSRKLSKSILEVVVVTAVVLIELVVEVGVVELAGEVGSTVVTSVGFAVEAVVGPCV